MSDISRYLEKAERYLQRGKPESALEEYLSALDIDPGNETVRQNAADVALSLGRTHEAILHLEWLFQHLYSKGESAKALINFRKLAKITEPTPQQNFQCAELTVQTNRKAAQELYEKALAGFSALDQQGDALECIKRIVELEPTLENLHRAGELASNLQQDILAARYFRSAGRLEIQEGGAGLAALGRAYHLDKSNESGAFLYAHALLTNGEPDTAAKVIGVFAQFPEADVQTRSLYAQALLHANRPDEAYPLLWNEFQTDPGKEADLINLIDCFLVHDNTEMALNVAHNLLPWEQREGRVREFAASLRQITAQHPPNAGMLEFLCDLFNTCSLEHEYCETLLQVYDLNYSLRQFKPAADALERAVQVDAYAAGHLKRLELLQGKIDDHQWRAIRSHIQLATNIAPPEQEEQTVTPVTLPEETEEVGEDQPKVIEDFMLQAEIFLQYSMRSKALERLARIARLFPGEEQHNERLRRLYQAADFTPPPVPGTQRQDAPGSAAASSAVAGKKAANENAIDNFERVTEITRNIHRQPNVKAVLFTAANDAGRHWNVSRCVAGLCLPGKPPSTALEYCAPGVPQSDVNSLINLIRTLQVQAQKRGPITLESAPTAPELESISTSIASLGIKSLMAIPLLDGDAQIGILIWEQCDAKRVWRSLDVMVAKTIADQVTLAVNNAKLRSLMKSLAVTEEQSGLIKRSSYLDVLQSEIRRAMTQNSTSTIMLVSLDASLRIKELGEAGVDAAMDKVAKAILPLLRQNDIAVRYNLATVALLLPDTNGKNAFFVHEKIRKAVGDLKIPGCPAELQMNVGIAEALVDREFDPVDIVTELINRAESALVMARSDGGNKAHAIAPAYTAVA